MLYFNSTNGLWIICVKYDALTDKRSFGADYLHSTPFAN